MDNKTKSKKARKADASKKPSEKPRKETSRAPIIRNDRGFRLAAYALAYDAALLFLTGFAVLMVAEGLMPGFVSGRINLAKPLALFALLLFGMAAAGRTWKISVSDRKPDRRLFAVLVLWSTLLVANSLLRFPAYAAAAILALTGTAGWLFYRILFPPFGQK
jgi:hypothetical protein